MVNAAAIILGYIAVLFLGYWLGRGHGKRLIRRAVARSRGADSFDMSIQPGNDGVMDLVISSKALKSIKRGESLQTVLKGAKNSMVFRVRKL